MSEQLTTELTTMQVAERLGYGHLKLLPSGDVACLHPLMYTCAILVLDADPGHALMQYKDRWCYCDYERAKAALDAWDGTGEPTGWHRHPSTGRRRENGDPTKEHVCH